MVALRDEGQLMPMAAQAALSRVLATSRPSLPAQHVEAWLRLKERAAISDSAGPLIRNVIPRWVILPGR